MTLENALPYWIAANSLAPASFGQFSAKISVVGRFLHNTNYVIKIDHFCMQILLTNDTMLSGRVDCSL